jgi:hypothetical protein
MHIQFRESIDLKVEDIYPYFKSPPDWGRLYGFAGRVRDLGGGWYAVPLHRFPFPLVARVTQLEPGQLVHWAFRGFWKGEGEVRFERAENGTVVLGYEQIAARWLGPLSVVPEKLFMERPFLGIWARGWRRLRAWAAGGPKPGQEGEP